MNRFLLFAALSFSLVSCSKEDRENKSSSGFEDIVLKASTYTLNSEGLAILDEMQEASRNFAVLQTANYGEFVNIKVNGTYVTHGGISINSNTYLPNLGSSSYLIYDSSPPTSMVSYFGNNIVIKDNSTSETCEFYSPAAIAGKILTQGQNMELDANQPNILSWNKDDNNPTGKVAIYYKLYTGDMANSNTGPYLQDYVLLDDNGSYDISNLLDSKTGSIMFILVRGNGRNLTSSNISSDVVFFNVRSEDHHYYLVSNN